MFPSRYDLKTESDVEQKFIWPLLISDYPAGLEYKSPDIVTKLNIRRLEIGKGATRKLYYPDYLIIMAGFPVLVIEAKAMAMKLRCVRYWQSTILLPVTSSCLGIRIPESREAQA